MLLKAEHLQKTGSFKARGASNKVALLTGQERAAGLHAMSSGTHAGAMAWAGRRAGCRVDVHMPCDAPALKRRAAEAYGATVHLFDRAGDRDAIAAAWRAEHGGTPVPPFDDLDVMAGQGTVALGCSTRPRWPPWSCR